MSGNQPTPTTLTPPTLSHTLQTHGVPPFRRITTVSRSSTCITTVAATTSLVLAQRTPRGKDRLWIWRGPTLRFARLPRRHPRIRPCHRHSRRLMCCLLIRVSSRVCRTVCTIAGRALSRRRICSCEKPTITNASARAGTGVLFESEYILTCRHSSPFESPFKHTHTCVRSACVHAAAFSSRHYNHFHVYFCTSFLVFDLSFAFLTSPPLSILLLLLSYILSALRLPPLPLHCTTFRPLSPHYKIMHYNQAHKDLRSLLR